MSDQNPTPAGGTVYRVDKFIVPAEARTEFMEKVRITHAILKQQPGFVRDLLLEQTAGPGRFNIVTIAEWESQTAVDQAREAVAVAHRQIDFRPQELVERLGIQADLGNYRMIG